MNGDASTTGVSETYLAADYSETLSMIRMLTDVRFKLLALVPTVSALGVVVAADRRVGDAIGISLIGLVATLGFVVYDLRNSQLYSAAMHRAKALEKRMALRPSNPRCGVDTADPKIAGGMVSERPGTLRLAGVLIKHDRGLALVYSAAITGWVYILASSALALVVDGESAVSLRTEASATAVGTAIALAALAGMAVWLIIGVFDRRGDKDEQPEPAVTAEEAARHRSPRWIARLVRSGQPSKMSSVEARYHANRPSPAGGDRGSDTPDRAPQQM